MKMMLMLSNAIIQIQSGGLQVIQLRAMQPRDWVYVREIYKNGIETGLATFETTAPARKDWDNEHFKFARLVATQNGNIAGWAALSPVSQRSVYAGLAEVSIYVSEKFKGKGIGKVLLHELINESESQGVWLLQAAIIAGNFASIRLHEQAGFRLIGYREKLGKLNGEWKDVIMLEKRSRIVGIN